MTEQKRPIYLDYQATTPVDPRVMDAMLPFFTEAFGNPHSTSHAYGWEARDAVEAARAEIAAMINAEPREIVFTSGATESNNMAIKGAARFRAEHRGGAGHLVIAKTEHKCVLEAAKYMARHGAEVSWVPVGADGLIDPAAIAAAIRDDTVLVSVMLANNEIGTIQPIAEIGRICRDKGVYLHTDAAQAAGKIGIDVAALNVDLLSLSAHKMYGPMGIGALYVRRRPRVRLEPLFDGGGQERTMRSGTLPAPLVVGFGEAARIAAADLDADSARIGALRDQLLQGLQGRIDDLYVNGTMTQRLPGNLNVGFPGVGSDRLMDALKDIVAVSSGSACTSDAVEPSYVLRAIGLSDDAAHSSIRLCAGRMTTAEEIQRTVDAIARAVQALRAGQDAGAAVSAA